MRQFCVAFIAALWLILHSACASPGPVNPAQVKQILETVDLIPAAANIPSPGPMNYYGRATPYKYGTALKTSAYYIPRPALQGDDATNSVIFDTWPEFSGYKMYMTWRDGDHNYFTGQQLFKDIGQAVYHVQGNITDPIDPNNPGAGTYEEYYAIPYNHTQPNQPPDFRTPIPDNQISEASLVEILEGFRWCSPDATHLTTQAEFDSLCRVYYNIISSHCRGYFATNILPFAVVGIPGVFNGTTPLANLSQLLPNSSQIVACAPPIPVLGSDIKVVTTKSGRQAFQFTTPPTGYGADSHWYHYRMRLWYEFQQVPSQVNIQMPPAPDIVPQIGFRNGTNRADLEGPMAFPPFPAAPGIFSGTNADFYMHVAMNNTSFTDSLHTSVDFSTAPLPSGYTAAQLSALNLTYFQRYPATPVEFDLTSTDITSLTSNPAGSNLAVEFAPQPMFTFDPRHLADFGPDQMQSLMQTNVPVIPPCQIRQAAIQIYVTAEFQIWQGNTPDSANNEFTASQKPVIYPGANPALNPPAGAGSAPNADYFRVVDDVYALTENYLVYMPKSLQDLQNRTCVPHRVASTAVIGDPYQRNTQDLPKRDLVQITPSSADPALGFPKTNRRDQVMAVFPDARLFQPGTQSEAIKEILKDYAVVPQFGNPNSRGEAFVEATIGRGLSFNYVYSKSGQKINPDDPRPPQAYWTDARHVAAVWPYETGTLDQPDVPVKVGPYVLNLDTAGQDQLAVRYLYADAPYHYPATSPLRDQDLCTPVVLSPTLLAEVNDMYDKAVTGEVHMTADVSGRFGVDVLNNGYKYSADLKVLTPAAENVQSLILRVPTILNNTTPFPFPWGVVPLLPQFSTFIGTLGAEYPGSNLLENPGFIGSYDARVKSNRLSNGLPSGLGYTGASLDQTIDVISIDGCGNQHVQAQISIASASAKHPTCSLYVKSLSDASSKGFALGVPISPGNLIFDNQDYRPQFSQYTTVSSQSLSSRVNDQIVANLQKSDVLVLDGTLGENQAAPVTIQVTRGDPHTGEPTLTTLTGQAYNPGTVFFRPVTNTGTPDPSAVVIKGHQIDLEFAAESAIPPGSDMFDRFDNMPGRAYFVGKEFAGTIRRMTAAIFPPNSSGGYAAQAEQTTNLFVFLQTDFASSGSGQIPAPPVGHLTYVFRQSTSPMPLDTGPVPSGNNYYLVQVDVEDINGGVRRVKIPIWVRDESANIDLINEHRERK